MICKFINVNKRFFLFIFCKKKNWVLNYIYINEGSWICILISYLSYL